MPQMSSPLRDLVGDKTAKVLEKGLGLRTCGDLLRHYPRRYVERGVLIRHVKDVCDQRDGQALDWKTLSNVEI